MSLRVATICGFEATKERMIEVMKSVSARQEL